MIDVLQALVLGFLFGWLLHKAGLTHYARIVNVYRLRDMTVMRFMLTALLVGGVLLQAGLDLGIAERAPLPSSYLLSNLVGGVVFGVGMATAGYCPGTIVAEAGEGRLDAVVAGATGLLVGALSFGLISPWLLPSLRRSWALGRTTVPELLGVSPWLVLLVFAELVAIVLVLVRKVGAEPEGEAASEAADARSAR